MEVWHGQSGARVCYSSNFKIRFNCTDAEFDFIMVNVGSWKPEVTSATGKDMVDGKRCSGPGPGARDGGDGYGFIYFPTLVVKYMQKMFSASYLENGIGVGGVSSLGGTNNRLRACRIVETLFY
ncbi:hypothetical protein VTL71DRAFT_3042 [Oculimacula yallundae]|uniref:Uncharacterized protein n=1 Tax=Oculimacula yallundae TaxID=86028 RepID=A0ABR4C787_9HELO